MRKLACAAAISAVAFSAAVPTTASATYYVPHVVVIHTTTGTSSAAGAAATGGFLGFVAALATYDFIRRTTCSGDFLHLGGPGFTEPMPVGNVMIPQCRPLVKHKRTVLRARG
jgi:hypothetical protein